MTLTRFIDVGICSSALPRMVDLYKPPILGRLKSQVRHSPSLTLTEPHTLYLWKPHYCRMLLLYLEPIRETCFDYRRIPHDRILSRGCIIIFLFLIPHPLRQRHLDFLFPSQIWFPPASASAMYPNFPPHWAPTYTWVDSARSGSNLCASTREFFPSNLPPPPSNARSGPLVCSMIRSSLLWM